MKKEWSKLTFYDPKATLIEYRQEEQGVALMERAPGPDVLRSDMIRDYREGREAALFCYAISQKIKRAIEFTIHESQDYDAVARWDDGDETLYTPIQLKEVVPKTLNSQACIETIIQNLSKYVVSQDLVVVIHFNQEQSLNFADIKPPHLNVKELWVFGALDPAQSKWFVFGDLLAEAAKRTFFEFDYPVL
jgi:hypothetical protein